MDTSEISILGNDYSPKTDTFVFRVPKWDDNTAVTNQSVYSYLSKRYDACGFIEPLKLQFKLEYHRLKNLTFEEEIPRHDAKEFIQITKRISGEYHVARYTGEPTEYIVMSDASDKAWGIVVNERHDLDVYRSKSKLFATIRTSIPRAEFICL